MKIQRISNKNKREKRIYERMSNDQIAQIIDRFKISPFLKRKEAASLGNAIGTSGANISRWFSRLRKKKGIIYPRKGNGEKRVYACICIHVHIQHVHTYTCVKHRFWSK